MKQEILNCLIWLANRVAETTEYKMWSDEFCRKEIKEAKSTFDKEIAKHIDWDNLTEEDCNALHFGVWSKESPKLRLIPLYLLPVLPIGTKVISINGREIIYDGNNIDNDHRFGCLAYGIIIKQYEQPQSKETPQG